MSTRPGSPASAHAATAAPAPADAADKVHVRHGRLRDAAAKRGVPLATILVTVAVLVLVYLAGKLAYRIRDVLSMIAVAAFVCLILNPLVVALQRWGIRRRGWAVAIVATWTVAVFIGLLAAFGYPLAHGVTHFSQRLPSYVQAAEHGRGWIGGMVTRFHLQAWVNRNAPKLQSLGTTLAKPALTAGKGAASLLATLVTIFALIVLFLLEGPKLRQGLLQLMSPERAAYCTRVAREIGQSATGYALGNLLTSLVAGGARSHAGSCTACCSWPWPRASLACCRGYQDQAGHEAIRWQMESSRWYKVPSLDVFTTIRGIGLCGTDFASLEPVDPSAAAGRLPLNGTGELSDCVLSGDLPCTMADGGQRRPATIAFSLDLHGGTASRPGPDHALSLSLVLDGVTYQVTDDWFEDGVQRLEHALPPGAQLVCCVTCLFSDYSPGGHGLTGIHCHRGAKEQYLAVRSKKDYWPVPVTEEVPETYLCEEYQRRIPGTGYRG